MEPELSSSDFFAHARVIIGVVIGLGITRTLLTIANIIQHPHAHNRSLLHMLWLGAMLLQLIIFWFWHFDLSHIAEWSFPVYLFFILYAVCLFLLVALLTPDKSEDYAGYEGFFIRRRHWFYAILAISMLLDVVDSHIMYAGEPQSLVDWLPALAMLPLCLWGWLSTNKRVQYAIVGVHWGYLGVIVLALFTGYA